MSKEDIIHNAMQIEGMVSEWDLDLLYDQSMEYVRPGGFAMEIGGWKGRSTYLLGKVCEEKGATLYELDTFAGVEDPNSRKNQEGNLNGYYEAFTNPDFIEIMKRNVAGLPVKLIKGDSKITIAQIPDKSLDYAFLDGNHDAPFIDMDIKNTIPKMRVGGLMTGHDHGNPDTDVHGAVKRVLNDKVFFSVRPVVGDPKYALTIWAKVISEEDYAKV